MMEKIQAQYDELKNSLGNFLSHTTERLQDATTDIKEDWEKTQQDLEKQRNELREMLEQMRQTDKEASQEMRIKFDVAVLSIKAAIDSAKERFSKM